MLVVFLAAALQDADALVDRLFGSDIHERETVATELVRRGRAVYPALKKALAGTDADTHARAADVAYAIGMDPETHRPWEELWSDYAKTPGDETRAAVLRIAPRIKEPRLALMRRISDALFSDPPECAWGGGLRQDAPEIAEWEVAVEVIQATSRDTSKEWRVKLAALEEPDADKVTWGGRPWTLFAWGVHLLQNGAPRRDALAAWRCQLKLCPGSEYEKQVQGYVAALEQMVKEDGTTKFAKPVDKISPQEQAAYWVFQLRDVDARQRSQPGECHIASTKHPAPAALKALGQPAIAALVECLGDARLTRSVGYWRNFSPHRTVLTYHDAAVQLLDDITGLNLYQRASTSDYPSLRGMDKLKQAYRDWWEKAKDQEPAEWWREAIAGTRGDMLRALARSMSAHGSVDGGTACATT